MAMTSQQELGLINPARIPLQMIYKNKLLWRTAHQRPCSINVREKII